MHSSPVGEEQPMSDRSNSQDDKESCATTGMHCLQDQGTAGAEEMQTL